MFRTVPKERLYLGIIHPVTGEYLYYDRLPMGTRNSPAASGRFGLSFVRELLCHGSLFGGLACNNSLSSQLSGLPYDCNLGEGRVMLGEDGLPGVLVWLHVDDLLLHGPTPEKVGRALTLVMDEALRMGLICQKKKTIPPCQVMRYCGFDYDTTGIPTLCIPPEKVSKALAFIDFLDRGSQELQTKKFARLTLSVVVGVLQSLVEATPANLGASFLGGYMQTYIVWMH